MEKIYTKDMQIPNIATDRFGRMKTSWLLACLQEVAGEHSELLGASNGEYNGRNLFWAVTRHKVEITRLPEAKENITLQTWPCPTTRVAYPRATVAYDKQGNELFRAMSLWVLMDADSRAMILPGKSGVLVEGITTGREVGNPVSLAPAVGGNCVSRPVRYTDLDVNGHMNNTQYLNWVDDLLPSAFHRDHAAKEFTICYLNEAKEDQVLDLSGNWRTDCGWTPPALIRKTRKRAAASSLQRFSTVDRRGVCSFLVAE